ncbi:hypothetical protein [Streptomyces sp. NPDC001076]
MKDQRCADAWAQPIRAYVQPAAGGELVVFSRSGSSLPRTETSCGHWDTRRNW